MKSDSEAPLNPAFAAAKARIDARIADLRRQVAEGPPMPPKRSKPVRAWRDRVHDVVVLLAFFYPLLLVVNDFVFPDLIQGLLYIFPRYVLATLIVATIVCTWGGMALAYQRLQWRWLCVGIIGLAYGFALLRLFAAIR